MTETNVTLLGVGAFVWRVLVVLLSAPLTAPPTGAVHRGGVGRCICDSHIGIHHMNLTPISSSVANIYPLFYTGFLAVFWLGFSDMKFANLK